MADRDEGDEVAGDGGTAFILTSDMADRDEGDKVAGDGGTARGCPEHPQR